MGEYKPKYYFWGFVLIYKKVIVVVLNFIFSHNRSYKIISISLILYVYLIFSQKNEPYKINYFNKKDYMSIYILLVLMMLNLLHMHSESEILVNISYIIAQTVNQLYFYHLISKIVYYRFNKAFKK